MMTSIIETVCVHMVMTGMMGATAGVNKRRFSADGWFYISSTFNGSLGPKPNYRKSKRASNQQEKDDGNVAHKSSVARTAATATATASARKPAGGSGAARSGSGKDGQLNRCFLAGTLGAGDFLLLVDDDFFKVFVAFFADVFVDGHEILNVITSEL